MRRPGPPLHGDMQTPRREVNSTNEDSDAVASAGDAVATIAPLAPVERRWVRRGELPEKVLDRPIHLIGSQPSVSPEILKLEELVGKPIRGGITSAHCRAHFRSAPFFQTLSNGICQIA